LVSSVFFGLPNCQIRVICLFGWANIQLFRSPE
jgi:hypothetical protein